MINSTTGSEPLDHERMAGSTKLSGIDELYAAMKTELSCINLLVFDRPGATFNTMVQTFEDWQAEVPSDEPRVLEPALRRNAERLIRFGLVERLLVRNEDREFPHNMTDRGVVASAFSGHTLDLANRRNLNLTELYGTKVRRINDSLEDDSPVFSSALYRMLTLAAIAKHNRETRTPVKGSDIPELPGLDGVEMSEAQKIKNARELATAEYLAIDSIIVTGNGTGVAAHHYSINPDRQDVVDELEGILRGVYIIDEAWPDFINDGLRKARKIKKDPEIIAKLLDTRAGASQAAYQVSATELWETIEELDGDFTNRQLIERLGSRHDTHYISNRLGGMVTEGLLQAESSDGSNRFRYSVVHK